MEPLFILLIVAIISAYLYAFVSGFTDAAQAIAEPIGARSFTPLQAVSVAAVLEIVGAFYGALILGGVVAKLIGQGLVHEGLITLYIVPAAVFGGLTWSLITYRFGIPVSETHALIGGIVGAAIGISGTAEVVKWGGLTMTIIAVILAPLLGFIGGYLLMKVVLFFVADLPAARMSPIFHNLQRAASCFLAFSHGANDAQKPMGVLAMALVLGGVGGRDIPLWVIATIGVTAGLGMFYGGWRIVKTLALRVTRLSPAQGFVSNSSSSIVLQVATAVGAPISTTHVDASALIGTGAARRLGGVRWKVAFNILFAWVITLPMAMVFGFVWGYGIHRLYLSLLR